MTDLDDSRNKSGLVILYNYHSYTIDTIPHGTGLEALCN